ncbi:hypothetical protein [Arenimonas sp.]|jgi:hypothetical protein|uniref:hypothetical protein n=1 Tax=Arenimonas sp. TaxID=1872635 RepID=UPI0037C077AD
MDISLLEKIIFSSNLIPTAIIFWLVWSSLRTRLNLTKSKLIISIFFILTYIVSSAVYSEISKITQSIWLRGWLTAFVPFTFSAIIISFFVPTEKKSIEEKSVLSKKLFNNLDSSGSRVWFIVFIAGITLSICSYILFLSSSTYLDFIDVLQSDSQRYKYIQYLLLCGAACISTGYIFAFHYKSTIGRLLGWIRHG